MKGLNELAARLVQVRVKRLELERQVDDIKSGEEKELTDQIMALMSADGLKSCNIPGVARLATRTTHHYEITDIESLSMVMFKQMILALKSGRNISDALMFQRRPSKESIEAYMHDALNLSPDDEGYNTACAGAGITYVDKDVLSVTKA